MTYFVDALRAGQADRTSNHVKSGFRHELVQSAGQASAHAALSFNQIRIASPAETARQYIELDCGHHTSYLVTRIAHFELELPSFKRHQHASEFVPLDAATIYDDAWPT